MAKRLNHENLALKLLSKKSSPCGSVDIPPMSLDEIQKDIDECKICAGLNHSFCIWHKEMIQGRIDLFKSSPAQVNFLTLTFELGFSSYETPKDDWELIESKTFIKSASFNTIKELNITEGSILFASSESQLLNRLRFYYPGQFIIIDINHNDLIQFCDNCFDTDAYIKRAFRRNEKKIV